MSWYGRSKQNMPSLQESMCVMIPVELQFCELKYDVSHILNIPGNDVNSSEPDVQAWPIFLRKNLLRNTNMLMHRFPWWCPRESGFRPAWSPGSHNMSVWVHWTVTWRENYEWGFTYLLMWMWPLGVKCLQNGTVDEVKKICCMLNNGEVPCPNHIGENCESSQQKKWYIPICCFRL